MVIHRVCGGMSDVPDDGGDKGLGADGVAGALP